MLVDKSVIRKHTEKSITRQFKIYETSEIKEEPFHQSSLPLSVTVSPNGDSTFFVVFSRKQKKFMPQSGAANVGNLGN